MIADAKISEGMIGHEERSVHETEVSIERGKQVKIERGTEVSIEKMTGGSSGLEIEEIIGLRTKVLIGSEIPIEIVEVHVTKVNPQLEANDNLDQKTRDIAEIGRKTTEIAATKVEDRERL